MGDRVIPNAVILPKNPSGQSTPGQANNIAQASTKQQVVSASRDSVIPIVYGGYERMAGMLYVARVYQSKLLLCLLLCEGPIEEIGAGQLNDADIPSSVTVHKYLGTSTQTVDPYLAAAIPGFAEAMRGTAYVVVLVPAGVSTGFPQFTFLVKGRKVYDPRDGTQSASDSSTWKWSDNPALCLGDFLSSQTYGARKDVDWTSVTAAANYCDQTVTGAGGSEKRALITLALAQKQPVKQWIDALRAYIPAWVDYNGATAMVIADMPRSSDFTFDSSNIDTEVLPVLTKRGVRDTPNVIQIGYMRTDVTPWAMDYAEAVAGTPAVRRVSRVDLPGIRRYSQALRFATESLNHYTLEDLEGQVAIFEDGIKIFLGDRATLTDDIGLSAKEARITGRQDRGFGRWLIGWREYDPLAYSNTVELTPSSPDTGRPDPTVVQAPTSLVINEVVYLEKNLPADSLARGLIYQSRFECSVTASTHAYPVTYRWKFLSGATVVHEGTSTGTSYASPAVQQGNTYTIDVIAVNALGFESPVLEGTQTALGKLLPPGDVPAITNAQEIGGEVHLQWTPAVDIDIERYEWRYTPNQTAGGTWEGAMVIDRIDGLRAFFKGLPVGTHRFYVKAIDSVGNYSTNAKTVDLTVTSDADAFLQAHEFTAPTLTNMIAIPPLEGVWKQRWATCVAADVFTSVEPNPFNTGGSGAAAVISHHASATSKFQGDAWDLGALVTGDWILTPNTTDIVGTATYAIETSPDNVTYTSQPGLSFKGAARYVRPVIQTTTTGTMVITAPPKIALSAITRKENSDPAAPITSSATLPTTISLSNRYVKFVQITITVRGTVARSYTLDNVVSGLGGTNTFDVYLFNAAGVQVASQFDWSVEGF